MKTRNLIPTLMIAAALTSLTFMISCKKDDSMKDTEDAASITANADLFQEAEASHSDVDEISDMAVQLHSVDGARMASGGANSILTCATVTNDTINQVITVDFSTGCTGHHGHVRSGQIIIHYSGGSYFTPGFQRIITFNNYYVDSRHIEGTRTITNNGLNAANHLNWSISAVNMRITRPSGQYHEWNSQRNREMIAGDTLLSHPEDDIYSITGSGSGTNSNGNSCTTTITNPLIKRGDYRFIVSGTVVITPSNRPTRTLDYGNGALDDIATVTKNGVVHTIHLN